MFKDVIGCTAAHPPWLCKVFGKLPAGEREKLIMDNRLCLFCLLHDKDRPCGAKQRPVSVACAASSCNGRHIQKLHDFLKDVFREENRVHVVHGDDGWEESDEAWELGEEEMMIVGPVQQEGDCSWPDACNVWVEQDEEVAVGVHQVRICQEGAKQSAAGQCKKASTIEEGGEAPEPDGLLLEMEEQEYFLELLMRRASPERPKASQPTKSKAAPAKGKEGKKNKKKEKKAPGRSLAERIADGRVKEERTTKKGRTASPADGLEKQPALTLPTLQRPRAGGWLRAIKKKKEQAARPQATSGGECSGQKTPDYS
jgi:hypothetical protein